jgi:hypothetical protein
MALTTNGNELIPGKKYIVRTSDRWEEEIYGKPPATEELIFARYDRIHEPLFHSYGHIVGKPSSTYVYERVLSERVSAKARRPASTLHRSSKRVPEESIAANRAKTARALARRTSAKGGYRKNKKQTRRRNNRR